MDVGQPENVDKWRWADVDLRLLLQQFRGLKVTQQYKQTQKQLTALGPEGQLPLARVQMEMLGKVVNDFLAQLSTQLSTSPAAGEGSIGMTQSEEEPEAEASSSQLVGKGSGSGRGRLGVSQGVGKGQGGPKGDVRQGETGALTSSQVKKKNGLQQKREQLKAGELFDFLKGEAPIGAVILFVTAPTMAGTNCADHCHKCRSCCVKLSLGLLI